MHQIQFLDWDTIFFGYKVGKICLSTDAIIDSQLPHAHDFDLVYIFTEQLIDEERQRLMHAILCDIKIKFTKEIKTDLNAMPQDQGISKEVIEIKPIHKLSDNLFHLVLESGIYSRFKQDENFTNNEFERLYKAFIENALNDNDAEVLGAFINDDLVGFVSISLKAGVANIGLIAVNEKDRGKHIGKKLLQASYTYAQKHQSKALTVVTQETNIQAMQFYQKNGFKINHKNYIYHLWKKTS
jgi:dTDP-4-amino-4,6-dideoxy-D-galactose acyltransferase